MILTNVNIFGTNKMYEHEQYVGAIIDVSYIWTAYNDNDLAIMEKRIAQLMLQKLLKDLAHGPQKQYGTGVQNNGSLVGSICKNTMITAEIKKATTTAKITGTSAAVIATAAPLPEDMELLEIANSLVFKSSIFNLYIIYFCMAANFFEWLNLRNKSNNFNEISTTAASYSIGFFLNFVFLKFVKHSPLTLFLVASILLVCHGMKNLVEFFYFNGKESPMFVKLCSIIYPIIITNLIKLYYANLRMYVQPSQHIYYKLEKIFLFYGANALIIIFSIASYFSELLAILLVLIVHLDLLVLMVFVHVFRFHLLLNVLYRHTSRNLMRINI